MKVSIVLIMGAGKKTAVVSLGISLMVLSLQGLAPMNTTEQLTPTSPEQPSEPPPQLLHEINIDPNQLPAGVTQPGPVHHAPHRVYSIAWNKKTGHIAVGIASGTGRNSSPALSTVQIYSIGSETFELLHTLTDATHWVRSLAYNHDGSRLAVGGYDKMVRIYDGINPASPLQVLSHAKNKICALTYNPSGSRLAAGGWDQATRIYNGSNPTSPMQTLVRGFSPAMSLAYNPDGSRLATGGSDRRILIYDGKHPGSPLHILDNVTGSVRSLAYSPGCSRLAAGGTDKKVRIYDGINPGSPLQILTHATDWVWSLTYSPDASWLAVGGADQKVRIYDGRNPDSPLHTLTDARGEVRSLAYNNDGSLLAVASDDQKVRIYRVSTNAGTDVRRGACIAASRGAQTRAPTMTALSIYSLALVLGAIML